MRYIPARLSALHFASLEDDPDQRCAIVHGVFEHAVDRLVAIGGCVNGVRRWSSVVGS